MTAQRRKWRWFLASGIMTLAASVGAFGFHSAAQAQRGNSYDAYVAAAQVAEPTEAMEYFKRSINLKPSDEKAYQAMLNYVLNDNQITSEEDAKLRAVFNETNGGSRSNIEYLKLNNAQEYEAFAYELGNAYFYTYQEANRRAKSQRWFEVAAASKTLEAKKVARAECLGKIASYSATLGVKNEAGDASTTYYDYWLDITSLINSDTLSVDNNVTALRSYKDFVYNVYTYMQDFKEAGITARDISTQLELVEQGVEGMSIDTADSVEMKLKQDILENIQQCGQTMEALYSGTVAPKEKEGQP